jgi:hypothetical protein
MCPENELRRRKKEKVLRLKQLEREAKRRAIQNQPRTGGRDREA